MLLYPYMKGRILVKNISENVGNTVVMAGWVNIRRDQGKMVFFDLRDMSGILQCVVLPNHTEALEVAKDIRPEWVLKVTGIVNKRPEKNINPNIVGGDVELEVTNIEVLSQAKELPFSNDAELNLDTLLDYRPLTLRRQRENAIFKVQNIILKSFREFLNNENFTEFRAPALVGGDAEGGTETFKLDYFYDKTAYLATSPQLYKQMCVMGDFQRVFEIGPVFRA